MERTRLTLRLPSDLAEWASVSAQQLGVTVNAFLVLALRQVEKHSATRPTAKSTAPVAAMPRSQQRVARERIERPAEGVNAPCPCGSGRKWKKCHGVPVSG